MPPGTVGSRERGSYLMQVALVLGGGEVGVGHSFLGVFSEFVGGKGTTVEGGVIGHSGGFKSDCTSSTLPFDLAGEGGHAINWWLCHWVKHSNYWYRWWWW
jgi:hypothetical protein